MAMPKSRLGGLEEVVYEYVPEPTVQRHVIVPLATRSLTHSQTAMKEMDAGLPAVSDNIELFQDRETEASADGARRRVAPTGLKSEYESFGVGAAHLGRFEAPEQRLARLQGEIAELQQLATRTVNQDQGTAAEVLGADPAAVAAELKVLESRLKGLASSAASSWTPGQGTSDGHAFSIPQSLASQIQRLASGPGSGPAKGSDGRVTYEISYVPSTSAIADSAKIAALESTLADMEKRIGVSVAASPFPDLHTAVTRLQGRVELLDPQRVEIVSKNVDKVMKEIDNLLTKKVELEGTGDKELGKKVNQLYDFCHRWSATAASLPAIVARLHSLQALHQQSATFSSRLVALEKQQDELTKLLETTSTAVQHLGVGLQENMAIVSENMRSLEEKMSKVAR